MKSMEQKAAAVLDLEELFDVEIEDLFYVLNSLGKMFYIMPKDKIVKVIVYMGLDETTFSLKLNIYDFKTKKLLDKIDISDYQLLFTTEDEAIKFIKGE